MAMYTQYIRMYVCVYMYMYTYIRTYMVHSGPSVAAESVVTTRCKVHCSLLQFLYMARIERVELNPQYAGNFGSERFRFASQCVKAYF